jgi:membrane-associated phospholipid phosphatase
MLLAAGWCVVAFFLFMALAYYVPAAGWLDAAALHGFVAIHRPILDDVATALAHLCDPLPYAIAGIATIAIAAKRRGPRTAAAVTTLLIGANLTSQLLKPLLAHHRELYYTQFQLYNIRDAAYPSGHSTAAMALSLALLIIVPRAYRPLTAALGALFTIAVSFSVLILEWHFPSDVVGGYLVATAWGLATFAVLKHAEERWPEHGTMRQAAKDAISTAPSTAAIARTALAAAVVLALIAATRAREIAGFADRHTAMVAVASAIAVAATVLLAAVVAISSSGSRSSR